MFSLQSVSHAFGMHQVLRDVSLQLESGETTALLGLNGAGKTTLIRIICGIISADQGSLQWDGCPINAAARNRMGYLPEERGLYPRMRIGEQLVYWGRLKGLAASDARKRALGWLDRLGIPQTERMLPSQLSKGMQQRVQFIPALLHEPDLLVLDEPFSGLDPIAAELLKSIMSEQKARGCALLISSHNIASLDELSDHMAVLHDGRLHTLATRREGLDQIPPISLTERFLQIVRPSSSHE